MTRTKRRGPGSNLARPSVDVLPRRKTAARRHTETRKREVIDSRAPAPSADPGQPLQQQSQVTFALARRPKVPFQSAEPSSAGKGNQPRAKHKRLHEIISKAPGWESGLAACLEEDFQPAYAPSRKYLKGLSQAVYLAQPAELNERLRRHLDNNAAPERSRLTSGDIRRVVREMRAEKDASILAPDVKGKDNDKMEIDEAEGEDEDGEDDGKEPVWKAALVLR